MIARLGLAALAILLVGAKQDDPLAGRVAGEPRDCIDASQGTNVAVLDRDSIAYSGTQRVLWVSHPIGGCPSLRPLTTLIVERFGSQICRNDRFRTIDFPQSIPSPYCRMGPFTPYTKAK